MSCLQTSVGEGGVNSSRDVKYVQFLLCDWGYSARRVAIVVDGIVGPQTKAEIKAFQSQYTGIVDGRVDPNGPSIKALEDAHINNLAFNIGTSASKYAYLLPKPAAPGPLSFDDMTSRYFSALYASFT
jgi:peptidoglycan hydrolase-like protein with peptidoglycan-binding domain